MFVLAVTALKHALLDRVKPERERFEPRVGPGSWEPATPASATR